MATLFSSANQSITTSTFTGASLSVPFNVKKIQLMLSRTNWPVGGVTIGLQFSYDNGVAFSRTQSVFIPAWVTDGRSRHTNTDAVVLWSWTEKYQPTHLRVRCLSPSTFTARLSVDAL